MEKPRPYPLERLQLARRVLGDIRDETVSKGSFSTTLAGVAGESFATGKPFAGAALTAFSVYLGSLAFLEVRRTTHERQNWENNAGPISPETITMLKDEVNTLLDQQGRDTKTGVTDEVLFTIEKMHDPTSPEDFYKIKTSSIVSSHRFSF